MRRFVVTSGILAAGRQNIGALVGLKVIVVGWVGASERGVESVVAVVVVVAQVVVVVPSCFVVTLGVEARRGDVSLACLGDHVEVRSGGVIASKLRVELVVTHTVSFARLVEHGISIGDIDTSGVPAGGWCGSGEALVISQVEVFVQST